MVSTPKAAAQHGDYRIGRVGAGGGHQNIVRIELGLAENVRVGGVAVDYQGVHLSGQLIAQALVRIDQDQLVVAVARKVAGHIPLDISDARYDHLHSISPYSGFGKDERHDPPPSYRMGNRTLIKPGPPLSLLGVTSTAAKAVFPAKAGIH